MAAMIRASPPSRPSPPPSPVARPRLRLRDSSSSLPSEFQIPLGAVEDTFSLHCCVGIGWRGGGGGGRGGRGGRDTTFSTSFENASQAFACFRWNKYK